MANKQDIITRVAEATGDSKAAAGRSVEAVFAAISDALKAGDKVQILGFGSFDVRTRAARKGRNPQTGEEITIPASKTVGFKAGKALKELI